MPGSSVMLTRAFSPGQLMFCLQFESYGVRGSSGCGYSQNSNIRPALSSGRIASLPGASPGTNSTPFDPK